MSIRQRFADFEKEWEDRDNRFSGSGPHKNATIVKSGLSRKKQIQNERWNSGRRAGLDHMDGPYRGANDDYIDQLSNAGLTRAQMRKYGTFSGVKNVNSQSDVDQILSTYRKINRPDPYQPQQQQAAPEPEAKPEPPQDSKPSEVLTEARKRWQDKKPESAALQSGPKSGIQAAADYGNKATDDYSRRFLPQMKAQADLETLEIGRTGSDAVRKFAGEPPKLGDPKDLFNFYSKKINSAVE